MALKMLLLFLVTLKVLNKTSGNTEFWMQNMFKNCLIQVLIIINVIHFKLEIFLCHFKIYLVSYILRVKIYGFIIKNYLFIHLNDNLFRNRVRNINYHKNELVLE